MKYPNKKIQTGFTLIELMVVITILSIIASIAIPAYQDYVTKSRTTEATSILADLKIKMEQYYQDNRTYVGGPCTPTYGDKFFSYACSSGPSADAFTITATGVAGEGMSGFEYTVDQDNYKTSKFAGVPGNGCWLTSKGGSC